MLRKETNIRWTYVERKEGPFLRKKLVRYYRCSIGRNPLTVDGRVLEWKASQWDNSMQRQWHQPWPIIATKDGRQHWMFRGQYWWDDETLSPSDVQALIWERERLQRARLERARLNQQLARNGARPETRPVISKELKLAVYRRDGGRCVACGSTFDLQYDHVIPFSLGGATSLENLQLLCSSCNQAKGASFDL